MPALDALGQKKLIISELEEARDALHSPNFLLWLDGQNEATQRQASKLMLEVSLVHIKLVNAALADFVGQMDANANDIENAITSLDDAIVTANKEIELIQEIASFVNILKPFVGLI